MSFRWLAGLALMAGVATSLWMSSIPTASAPRNFLVIIADDLGTDKVGVYAEAPDPPATPRLDALAADGVWFRNAYATPTCSASRAALMTGRYGRRTGVGGVIDHESPFGLQLGEVTLPEALDRGGEWSAAALGKWHLAGWRSPDSLQHPLQQGFDRVRGSLGSLPSYHRWTKNVDGEAVRSRIYATTDTTDEAVAAMRELQEPFFLWVAYNAPHMPFHWPPGVEPTARSAGVRYDAMVTRLDSEVGRLLDAMTPELRATTVVVFVGDNGTPKEGIRPPFRRGHGKTSVFEGGTNVPLIVAGAGVIGRGESAALVHAVDLLPTILELGGVHAEGLVLDGVSFAPQLTDPSAPCARSFVYTERFVPSGRPPYRVDEYAIRDDRYKLYVRKRGQTGHLDLQGAHDDGVLLPDTVAPERFERLREELERIRRDTLFEW